MSNKSYQLFHSLHYLLVLLMLASIATFYSPSSLAQTACGEPTYDLASGPAVRIWQDCTGSGEWHVRATGDPNRVTYTGFIDSTQPITELNPFMLENHDQVSIEGQSIIIDPMRVLVNYQDGFDFTVSNDVTLTLSLSQPSDPVVLLGADQALATFPVTLTSGMATALSQLCTLYRVQVMNGNIPAASAPAECNFSADIATQCPCVPTWTGQARSRAARGRLPPAGSPYDSIRPMPKMLRDARCFFSPPDDPPFDIYSAWSLSVSVDTEGYTANSGKVDTSEELMDECTASARDFTQPLDILGEQWEEQYPHHTLFGEPSSSGSIPPGIAACRAFLEERGCSFR